MSAQELDDQFDWRHVCHVEAQQDPATLNFCFTKNLDENSDNMSTVAFIASPFLLACSTARAVARNPGPCDKIYAPPPPHFYSP